MKNSASLSSPESAQGSPTPSAETPSPIVNKPIITIYRHNWADHLLAAAFLLYVAVFITAVAIIASSLLP